MKGLYTAKEAREKLGVTDDKFQYMVRTGLVNKVMLPGRKYGLYSQAEVNRLAAAINATLEQYTKDESVFELATQADLPEIIAMCAKNVPRVTPIEKQRIWMKRNPEAFYTLRDNGEVAAYTCIFPVNYMWLQRVLNDEVRIGDVPLEEIYPFAPGTPLDVYIRDLIVDQNTTQEKATHHAQRILAELTQVFTKLGTRGVNIRAIYALATSPQGNRLAKKLGFRAMTELDNQTEGYMPCELLVEASDSPLISEYKTELQRYLAQTGNSTSVATHRAAPAKAIRKSHRADTLPIAHYFLRCPVSPPDLPQSFSATVGHFRSVTTHRHSEQSPAYPGFPS